MSRITPFFCPILCRESRCIGDTFQPYKKWWVTQIFFYEVCVIQDEPCGKIYTGTSTQSPVARFAQHRSTCNNPQKQKHGGTGLCNHFRQGCPNDDGRDKSNRGPGTDVVVFLLLMEPTMNSTTISLIPDGTNLLLTQNGWALAVK